MNSEFEKLGEATLVFKRELYKTAIEPWAKPLLDVMAKNQLFLMASVLAIGIALGLFISSLLWAGLCVKSGTIEINGKQHICMEVLGEE